MIINLNNTKNEEVDETINVEELQKETMESMKEYISNLIPKLESMVIELKSDIKEDTWEYLRMMVDGFNWVLEAYNGTSTIINADKSIDESNVQKVVDELGEAFVKKNATQTASSIENGVIPFLNEIIKRI